MVKEENIFIPIKGYKNNTTTISIARRGFAFTQFTFDF